MKKIIEIIYISAILLIAFNGYGIGAARVMETAPDYENLLLNPWVTFALFSIGMILAITRLAGSGSLGLAGTGGIICAGLAFAPYAVSEPTGIILLITGAGLMLIEARIVPGHGISAVAGVICTFTGAYMTLSGSTNSMLFPMSMAAWTTILSCATLFASIPGNSKWQALQKKIEFEKLQAESTIHIDTAVKFDHPHITIDHQEQKPVVVAEQAGRVSTRIPAGQDCIQHETAIPQIDELKIKLAEIETYAVPIVANQHRLEQRLSRAKESAAKLQGDARHAAESGEDDLARQILIQMQSCQAKVDELNGKLDAARLHSDTAKEHIQEFRNELQHLISQTHNADSIRQIAYMQKQIQQTVNEEMQVIGNFEDIADNACAETEAISAMDSNQDKIQEYNARRQRADQALADMKQRLGKKTTGNSTNSDQQQSQDTNQQIINRD
ncbi:MAG: PspA/IM30 family protein [Armatimonadota bacterium]